MLGWMDDEALHRTLTTGRCTYWSPQPPGVLGQGRHLRPLPAGQVRRPRLRRRHRARQGRPGRRRLPHRRPHLLRRRRPRRRGRRFRTPAATGSVRSAAMDLETFRKLAADRRVIPVTRKLLADGDTPVGLYRKLAAERPGTFLLESAENGRSWSRYSFVGVRSAATLTERDGQRPLARHPARRRPHRRRPARRPARHRRGPAHPARPGGSSTAALHRRHGRLPRLRHRPPPGEDRPEHERDDLRLPELTMLLTSDLAVLDHWDGTVLLIANAINHNDLDTGVDEAYADAVARLDAMEADLARPGRPAAPPPCRPPSCPSTPALWGGPDFQDGRRGHQGAHPRGRGLPGRPLAALRDALHGERAGRLPGPAGHQPVARTCTCSASTASTSSAPAPRPWSRSRTGSAMVHPIAGTRPARRHPAGGPGPRRGAARRPEGARRAPDARRPRPQRPGAGLRARLASRSSTSCRSSATRHVMHIVSTVTGKVAAGRTAFDVLTACFPAGTLSGAPKPRAMQIIDELEPSRRGLYGGCVGYLDFAGDSDTAIAIRTALLRDGTAYVQAGRRYRRRLRPGRRGHRVPQQGGGGAARGAHGEPAGGTGAPHVRPRGCRPSARRSGIVGYVSAAPYPAPCRESPPRPPRGRPRAASPSRCCAVRSARPSSCSPPASKWAEGTATRRPAAPCR